VNQVEGEEKDPGFRTAEKKLKEAIGQIRINHVFRG
jgi:hypothetical protein